MLWEKEKSRGLFFLSKAYHHEGINVIGCDDREFVIYPTSSGDEPVDTQSALKLQTTSQPA